MRRQIGIKQLSVDALALIGLAGVVVWFCDDMLFSGKVPFFRDLATYSYPIKFALAESFHSGEIALWNRHMAAGFPLLAAFQPGVFYPPNVVFYLFPFFDAVRCTFFFHFLIAASGAYCLCRQWKYPLYLSLIAAILFSFGGTTVSLSNLLNHFQTSVWLPWMLLCWERLLDVRSWKTFLTLTLVLLGALLAGSPEFYLFSVGLLLIDGIRLSFRDRKLSMTGMLLLLAAVNLVVAALGMIQFFPTLELLLQSRRDRPIPFNEASYWSLNPTSLFGVLLPDKEVDEFLPQGVRLFFAPEVPFLLSHYLGVLSLLGICAWFCYTSWKERVVIISLLVISLILALGRFTPVYGFLFDHISVFRIIRFPEKFFFLTFAFLVFAVLKGLATLHPSTNSRRNFPIVVFFGLLLVWSSVYLFSRFYPEALYSLITRWSQSQPGAATVASVFFNLERQIAITFALLLVYYCGSKGLLAAPLKQTLLFVILLLDIGIAHKPLQFLLNPGALTKENQILKISDGERGRLFYYPTGRNLHPSSLLVPGWPSFQKAVALSFENLLPNAGVYYGFDYFQEIDALTRQPYNDFLDFANLQLPENRIRLFRALNIRYVVAFQPLEIPGLRLIHRFPEYFSWLYEIDHPVPRAYVASQVIYETQTDGTLRLLSGTEFDPLRQVILKESLTWQTDQGLAGEAKIIRYSNTEVVLDASLAGPGILVLTDSYYPGWKVLVDGKKGKILQANHFFRGVQLTSGKHIVEFRYEPWSFTVGMAISVAALVALTIGSLLRLIVRRKRRYQRNSEALSNPALAAQQE